MVTIDVSGGASSGYPEELQVRRERHRTPSGDVDVISLAGDLDAAGAIELRRALSAGLTPPVLPAARAGAPGGHLVVVDLAGAAFLDSSGIGALIALHRSIEEAGGRLALCCLPPQPLQVVTTTGADSVLAVHATLAEALRSAARVAPAT